MTALHKALRPFPYQPEVNPRDRIWVLESNGRYRDYEATVMEADHRARRVFVICDEDDGTRHELEVPYRWEETEAVIAIAILRRQEPWEEPHQIRPEDCLLLAEAERCEFCGRLYLVRPRDGWPCPACRLAGVMG